MEPALNTCIIVLAWNHFEDTLECLDSVARLQPQPAHVIVADNGSTDGTPGLVRAAYPTVRVVSSGANLGVAGGYNFGLRAGLPADATHVVITNNDVEFDSAALGAMQAAAATPDVGMVMPKIYHYFGDRTRLWCTGGRWRVFPPGVVMTGRDTADGPAHSKPVSLDYAPSCTLLVSVAALRELGFFDRGYFFYYDDWDFSARLRQAGFTIAYAPAAAVYHKVSISTQKEDRPARWWKTMGASSVRFYRKHRNDPELAAMTAWFALRETLKGDSQHVRPYLDGVHEALCSRG